MASASSLPLKWSVAGVTGPHMGRSPERLSRVVGDVTFEMARFPRTLTPSSLVGAYTTEPMIDVLARFNAAGAYVSGSCAKFGPCNAYFASLGKDMALSELLEWSVVFFFLKPVSRIGPVPQAGDKQATVQGEVISVTPGTRFVQIVLSEFSLASNIKLAATIVHELAHVAGAPGSTDDERARAMANQRSATYQKLIAAEMALKACLLPKQFDPGALGVLQDTSQGWRSVGRAIV